MSSWKDAELRRISAMVEDYVTTTDSYRAVSVWVEIEIAISGLRTKVLAARGAASRPRRE